MNFSWQMMDNEMETWAKLGIVLVEIIKHTAAKIIRKCLKSSMSPIFDQNFDNLFEALGLLCTCQDASLV